MYIWTHKFMQKCPYEYNPPVHKHVSLVRVRNSWVNVHQSNLRKNSFVKVLQDKTNVYICTESNYRPYIPSDKTPNILKYSVFFLNYSGTHLKDHIKMAFLYNLNSRLKHHNFWSRYPIEVKKKQ